MAERRPPHAPPSRADGEGVRVIAKPSSDRGGMRLRTIAIGVFAVLAIAALGWMLMREPARERSDGAAVAPVADRDEGRAPSAPPRPSSRAKSPATPGDDPNDLASYFQPGDPEPSGAQVIEALQQAGVRTGLGAFNPPGTSPPLVGLAVPEDFELPQGYVRHHQVTDEGVAIEPILMFSPDFDLRDARGRPIAMPADRVVPPELAPPGLPLRRIRIPPR